MKKTSKAPGQWALPIEVTTDGITTTAANQIRTGIIYVCVSEYGALKPGRTSTLKGLAQRIASHRKAEPTMHCVCFHIMGEYVAEEALLMDVLETDPDYLIAGTEWFRLTYHTANLVVDFMEVRGADTALMRKEFQRILEFQAHRMWGV